MTTPVAKPPAPKIARSRSQQTPAEARARRRRKTALNHVAHEAARWTAGADMNPVTITDKDAPRPTVIFSHAPPVHRCSDCGMPTVPIIVSLTRWRFPHWFCAFCGLPALVDACLALEREATR